MGNDIRDNRIFTAPNSDGTNGNIEWLLAGNTTTAIKKMGSLDDYEVSFITKNTERMVMKNNVNGGAIGIGANVHLGKSATKFWVNGESQFGDTLWIGGGASADGYISFSGGANMSVSSTGTNNLSLRSATTYIDFMNNGAETMRLTATGDLALGITVPVGRSHVFGVLNGISHRIEPVANVTEDVRGGTVNTTDATVTTIETIPVPTSKVIVLDSKILARVTGGGGGFTGQGCFYGRMQSFRNIAGTVTAIGTIQSLTKEDVALVLYDVVFTISGTNVLIQVNAQANDNTTWNSISKVNTV